MRYHSGSTESYVDLGFPDDLKEAYNIRLPVLIYLGYRLYNRLFFNQFVQICLFGILANIILVPIASLLFRYLMWLMSTEDMSYLQSLMLVSVSLFTDPMTIVDMIPNQKFFLHLGIFILGNCTQLNIFCFSTKLASLAHSENMTHDACLLLFGSFLDVVLGTLLGGLVGIITALMSILTRREFVVSYYETTIAVGGVLVSYFWAKYFTLQPVLSLLSCCLVQERFIFNNMGIDNNRAVKDGLKAVAHLVQGLFLLFVGYFLANVDSALVWQPALLVLAVTYVFKTFIMIIFLALLNIKEKSNLKKMFSDLPMLVFGGSRGPRNWVVVMDCQRTYHLPLFTDYVFFIIAFSVLLDTFIFKTISQFMDREFDDREVELECCFFNWLSSVEENLFNVSVNDTEIAGDDECGYERKREMKRREKLEQHGIDHDQGK